MTAPTPPTEAAITRPNGKVYRPRRAPRAVLLGDDGDWVYVLGTHDIERARPLALATARHFVDSECDVDYPHRIWTRLGYESGELRYLHDETRGAAAISFEVTS